MPITGPPTASLRGVAGYNEPVRDGNNFTNVIAQVVRTVYVKKTWVGDDPEPVTVQLYADGNAIVGKVLTLNAENDWSGTFAALDTYALAADAENRGHEIAYTIKEVAGATTPYHTSISGTGTETDPFVVSNAFDAIDIPVIKIWNDADDQDGLRPGSVTVELQYNAGTSDEPDWRTAADVHGTPVDALTLSAAANWSGRFQNLPRIDAAGEVIEYQVVETGVPDGYTTSVSGNAADGFTITNTHVVKTIDVSATKEWTGEPETIGDSLRPDEVSPARLKSFLVL